MGRKLNQIKIRGFKSLRDIDLKLSSLNVLIGGNGAGKSNFIALFGLLNEMVNGRFNLNVAKAGGASVLLYSGLESTERLAVALAFGSNAYTAEWEATADDSLVFTRESTYFRGDFAEKTTNYGSGHKESQLIGLSGGIPEHVLGGMKSWQVYHFHDTSEDAAMKRTGDLNDDIELRSDAGNLAAFLLRLRTRHPKNYAAIRSTVQRVAPFFDDFVLRPTTQNPDKIRLEWQAIDSGKPFLANQLSDGTIRFICLATVLLQPILPAAILIDEPELGLHPFAIELLGSLFRSTSQRTQLIVSTQSVALLNQVEPENVIVVDRLASESIMRRLTEEELSGWLEDYSLGELWEKNVFGGRPTAPPPVSSIGADPDSPGSQND